MKTNQIILFYDEECPFCKNYTNFLKLKKSFDLKLIDARKNKIELENIIANNPRALIDATRTNVTPNAQGNGYDIDLGIINRFTKKTIVTSFFYGKASD